MSFLILREAVERASAIHPRLTQVVVTAGCASEAMTPESIVEVRGVVQTSAQYVKSTTSHDVEIMATSIQCLSSAARVPYALTDFSPKLETKLQHRSYDLRTVSTQAALRLQSVLCGAFHSQMRFSEFVEVHTSKLLQCCSEGGSAVFEVNYYGKKAFLAQSPQLFKQMVVLGDVRRVYEVGPVFRAEKSFTHRHLSEFTGLDAEMVIEESYDEVLDVLEQTLVAMIHAVEDSPPLRALRETTKADAVVATLCSAAAEAAQNDSVSFGTRCGRHSVLRCSFEGACRLLRETRVLPSAELLPLDWTTPQERALGRVIKEKYGVDLFVVDRFPLAARPFYTMPHQRESESSSLSPTACAFDVYLRGEEICSGAQRVHLPTLLRERAAACGILESSIASYLEAFEYGSWPHGGFGIGLERLTMLLSGLADIRHASLFPRDPHRLQP